MTGTTNLRDDLDLREDDGSSVYFVDAFNGTSSTEITDLDLSSPVVARMVRKVFSGETQIGTELLIVPWSNIAAIRQSTPI